MSEQQQQIVICEQCKHEFDLKAHLQERPVGTDVRQVGVLCPNCDNFVHAFFETPDIAAARGRLSAAQARFKQAQPADKDRRWQQYKTQQQAYQRVFDAEQQRWRRKRHIPEKAA